MFDRHLIEEDSENALLHLSGILSTQNDHLLFGKVNSNRSGRSHTGGEPIGRERASIIDSVVWMEVLELLFRGTYKHISHEKSVVGSRANDPDVDPVPLIPASKAIDDVDTVSGVQVINCPFTIDLPDLQQRDAVSNARRAREPAASEH